MIKSVVAQVIGAKFVDTWDFALSEAPGGGRRILAKRRGDNSETAVDIDAENPDMLTHVDAFLRDRYGTAIKFAQYSMEF